LHRFGRSDEAARLDTMTTALHAAPWETGASVAHVAIAAAVAALVAWAAADWWRHSRLDRFIPYRPVVGHTPTALAEFGCFPEWVAARSAALGHPATALMKMGAADSRRWLLFTPADVEHVLRGVKTYHAGGGARGRTNADLFGRGIGNADGAHWLLQRRIAAREFSADRFRGAMGAVFAAKAAKLAGVIDALPQAPGAGAAGGAWRVAFNASVWFPRLTLDAFAAIALSADVGGLDGKHSEFGEAFDFCLAHLTKRYLHLRSVWPLLRWLNVGAEAAHTKAIGAVDRFVHGLIDGAVARFERAAAAGAAVDGEDLMTRLIAVAVADGGAVDRGVVRDVCVNFLLAGRDTTASALQWLLYELCAHPAAERDAVEEIERDVAGAAPNYDNCAGLAFLEACVWETMRLHPAAPFVGRNVAAADVLPSGLKVRPGETVIYAPYVIGRRPDLWGADAAEWRPARWLGADGKCQREGQYKLPAFGGGRRLCLGMDMAFFEIKVVVATLLQRFRFATAAGAAAPRPRLTATLQMQEDLVLHVTRR
jgi:cytochrome P450